MLLDTKFFRLLSIRAIGSILTAISSLQIFFILPQLGGALSFLCLSLFVLCAVIGRLGISLNIQVLVSQHSEKDDIFQIMVLAILISALGSGVMALLCLFIFSFNTDNELFFILVREIFWFISGCVVFSVRLSVGDILLGLGKLRNYLFFDVVFWQLFVCFGFAVGLITSGIEYLKAVVLLQVLTVVIQVILIPRGTGCLEGIGAKVPGLFRQSGALWVEKVFQRFSEQGPLVLVSWFAGAELGNIFGLIFRIGRIVVQPISATYARFFEQIRKLVNDGKIEKANLVCLESGLQGLFLGAFIGLPIALIVGIFADQFDERLDQFVIETLLVICAGILQVIGTTFLMNARLRGKAHMVMLFQVVFTMLGLSVLTFGVIFQHEILIGIGYLVGIAGIMVVVIPQTILEVRGGARSV